MMVAQFAFLFLMRQTTCQKFSTEMEVKMSDVIVKKQINKNVQWSVLLSTIMITNDAKMVSLEF